MPDQEQIVKVAVAGAAAFAAYKYLYEPWVIKQRLQAEIEARTKANLAQGMGLEEAAQKALSGACKAVALFYKIPPAQSGAACDAAGVIAEKVLKKTIQGAVIAGKVVGKGVKAGVLAVGHTGAVIGRGIGKGGKAVGSAVKLVSYTAPKKVITTGASAVKFVSYTAPKKVTIAVAKGAAKGIKSVAKSVSHGFGLWGVEEEAAAFYEARRQLAGQRSPGRKRRSLGGIPDGRPARRATGAAFYTRHL